MKLDTGPRTDAPPHGSASGRLLALGAADGAGYGRGMKAKTVDPRDQTMEVDDPVYRVYFWEEGGGAKEEWELSEGDLDEVLDWIPTRSLGRSHRLWAVIRAPQAVTLIRLRGVDLDTDQWPTWAQAVR